MIRPLRTILVALLGLAVSATFAQQDMMHTFPQLDFTVQNDAIAGPDSVAAGYYTLTVNDESTIGAELSIARLNEGATQDEVLAAVDALVASFETGEGGAEAEAQVMSLVTLVGGPSMPGNPVIDLEPGDYLIFSVGATDEGQSHTSLGLYQAFTVTPSDTAAAAPTADLTVDMMEFAFSIPDEVAAGEQVWEVKNVGGQIHHLVLMKIQDGKTMDDIMAFLETEEGAPPADDAGYVNVLSPGQHNFVTFDLEPGAYVAMCFITDVNTGQPHVALGMIDTFTVAGE